MIFTILKTYRDVQHGVKDPTGFGQGALLEVLKVPLIIFTISGILGLALFFILGYTELLVPSWGFFRFVFWCAAILFGGFEVVLWKLYGKMKRMVARAKSRVDEELKTITVEPK